MSGVIGPRQPAGTAFWISWIVLTSAGYAIGMGVDSILYAGTGTALSGVAAGVASTALYGAVVGGISAGLQALLLRRRLERPYEWVVVSALGGATGFVLGSAGAEIASNLIALRLNVYLAGAIIQIVFGAFSGAGIGLGQSLVIKRQVGHPTSWVLASIVGLTLGFSIPVGIMQLVDLPLLEIWFGATGGLLLGLTQWLWVRRGPGVV